MSVVLANANMCYTKRGSALERARLECTTCKSCGLNLNRHVDIDGKVIDVRLGLGERIR